MFHRFWGNLSEKIRVLRHEFKQESRVELRMLPAVLGPVLLWTTGRGERRLSRDDSGAE
jgi:hypothetical protein